jgi:hypothetical protein
LGREVSERECKFLDSCKELEKCFGQNVSPLRSKNCARPVITNDRGDLLDVAGDSQRRESEESLRYIRSESSEFPRIATRYRAVLDWAIKQYEGFLN